MIFSFNSLVCKEVITNEEKLPEFKGIFTVIEMDEKEMTEGFCIVNIGSVDGEVNCELVTVLKFQPENQSSDVLMARLLHGRKIVSKSGEAKNVINIINIPNKSIISQNGNYIIELYKLNEKQSIESMDVFDIIDQKVDAELLSFYNIQVK